MSAENMQCALISSHKMSAGTDKAFGCETLFSFRPNLLGINRVGGCVRTYTVTWSLTHELAWLRGFHTL